MAKKRLILGSGLFLLSLALTHMLWAEFRVQSLTVSNSNVRITWSAPAGSNYVVQVKTNAITGSPTNGFFDLGPTVTVAGVTEVLTNYTDTGGASGATSRFYRVRSVVTPLVLQQLIIIPTNAVITKTMTNLFQIFAAYSNGSTVDVTSVVTFSLTNNGVAQLAGLSNGLSQVVATNFGSAGIRVAYQGVTNVVNLKVEQLLGLSNVPPSLAAVVEDPQQMQIFGLFSTSGWRNISISAQPVNTNFAFATVQKVLATDVANSYALVTGHSAADSSSCNDFAYCFYFTAGGLDTPSTIPVNWCWYYSVSLYPPGATISVGQTQQFTISTYGSTTHNPTVTSFTSSDNTIATADSTSLSVVGIAPGTVTINLNVDNGPGLFCAGGVSDSEQVSVYGPTNLAWISSSSDKWETASRWDANRAPIPNDSIFITNAVTKTVTIDGATPVSTLSPNHLTLSAPNGATNTLDTSNLAAQFTIASDTHVNSGGALVISNASVIGNTANFDSFSVDGSLTMLNGGSLTITNALSALAIGYTGRGNFQMAGGAVLISGADVGLQAGANGTLTLGGGTVSSTGGIYLGNGSAATGTLWLTGAQLTISNSTFSVGENGIGSLTVSNGICRGVRLRAGRFDGARGTFRIAGGTNDFSDTFFVGGFSFNTNPPAGSVWISGGLLTVTNGLTSLGLDGQGDMTLSNGSVILQRLTIAEASQLPGSTPVSLGTLTVAGGTLVIQTNALVGSTPNSTGAVWITGGTMAITNSTSTGSLEMRRGTLTFAGGTLIADSLVLTNGAISALVFNTGTLDVNTAVVTNTAQFVIGNATPTATYRVRGGIQSFANGWRVRTNATLAGCGTVVGNGPMEGVVLADCGGTLTFSGIVTNFGTMIATNGTTLESYVTLVNNGTINFHFGKTNFHGVFINNGTLIP